MEGLILLAWFLIFGTAGAIIGSLIGNLFKKLIL